MLEDVVTIDRKKYQKLVRDSEFLEALEAAGVDNWNGYNEAWEEAFGADDEIDAG